MKKKLLSILLVLCVAASLTPLAWLTAAAAGGPVVVTADMKSPAAGSKASDSHITGLDTAEYEVVSQEWDDENGDAMGDDAVFAAGKDYGFALVVKMKDGSAFIAGSRIELALDGTGFTTVVSQVIGDNVGFEGAYTVPDSKTETPVPAIGITCPGYGLGGRIADAVPSVVTEGVELVDWDWVVYSDGSWNTPASDTFEADNLYALECFLNVKEGCTVTGLTKAAVTVNGRETDYYDDPWTNLSATGKSVDLRVFAYAEILTAPASAPVPAPAPAKTSPKTGDGSGSAWWLALAAASGLGVCVLSVRKKREIGR